MRTEEVAANIYRIPVALPNNPLKSLNSYLIKDPDQSLLVDTGFRMEECRADLQAGLAELNVEAGDLDIFITHLHADHTGLAPDLIGGGRKMMIGAVDRGWLVSGNASALKWGGNIDKYLKSGMSFESIGETPSFSPMKHLAPKASSAYIGLEEGHVLSVGGYNLRCVQTPGHTPGHMCLWDESRQLMFTGDHVLFDITPNITVWGNNGDSLGSYLNSLEDVKRYPVKTALPGHRASGDFAARIEALLAHHERRLAGILDIIGNEPGLSGAEIAKRMKWRIRAASWDEFPDTQKIFAVGEVMSHLDYLQIRDRIRSENKNGVYLYYLL